MVKLLLLLSVEIRVGGMEQQLLLVLDLLLLPEPVEDVDDVLARVHRLLLLLLLLPRFSRDL